MSDLLGTLTVLEIELRSHLQSVHLQIILRKDLVQEDSPFRVYLAKCRINIFVVFWKPSGYIPVHDPGYTAIVHEHIKAMEIGVGQANFMLHI